MKEMIKVAFDGYWLERYQSEVSEEGGIYCVYACEPMARDRLVVLRELLYIGESDNVKASIAEHEEVKRWKKRLLAGEELCYSFARVAHDVRGHVGAALIAHHRPPCNEVRAEEVHNVRVMIVGEHELLDDFVAIGDE
ncbi:MAG: hypothetical protein II195_01345 [Selenomonadales bacterium]|nr:hypothetical protein [Selenomonadales bacterium]